jgi:putative phosphoribosyl transferase
MSFPDRFEAGQALAEKLSHYRDESNVLVLGLARGGVPVAYEVAKRLGATLDVFLVRKLGVPGHEELAMGAVASGGIQVLNEEVVPRLGISEGVIAQVADRELREIDRQQQYYRPGKPAPRIAGRTIILVDDGLATGSTMRAAIESIRQQQPERLVVGVPVGAAETCAELAAEVDEIVCAVSAERFMAVGMWYDDFSPTSDQQVQRLLEDASRWEHVSTAH